jgi:hypothetical protein
MAEPPPNSKIGVAKTTPKQAEGVAETTPGQTGDPSSFCPKGWPPTPILAKEVVEPPPNSKIGLAKTTPKPNGQPIPKAHGGGFGHPHFAIRGWLELHPSFFVQKAFFEKKIKIFLDFFLKEKKN